MVDSIAGHGGNAAQPVTAPDVKTPPARLQVSGASADPVPVLGAQMARAAAEPPVSPPDPVVELHDASGLRTERVAMPEAATPSRPPTPASAPTPAAQIGIEITRAVANRIDHMVVRMESPELGAQSRSMGMISDNVSNVNTVAYKGAVAEFSTLVRRAARSSIFGPGGVRAGTLYEITNQGLIQNSSSPTDAAIDGRGFVVVNSEADGSGEQLYTRAGNFRTDLFGNTRNATGFYLQGWALDANEQVVNPNQLEVGNVDLVRGSVAATTTAELGINLDATQAGFAGAYAAGDLADFNSSGGASGVQPHFTRAIDVVDSLGRPHSLTVAFSRCPLQPPTPGTSRSTANRPSWRQRIIRRSARVRPGGVQW